MAIQDQGEPAISLTGGQIGIVTDSTHTKARIRKIDTERIRRELEAGKIVVAAGFQGIDGDFNITTLGARRKRHDGHGPGRRPGGR